ncbi:MAG: hypothetical protein NTU73_08450, partial [Ignavibacteriae bacterium]|nr:hypothetical protein [Ignavibacteriota bacterium]
KDFKQYSIFLSYIGFFYNFIFSLSLRGSKYWQEHWEIATNSCEKVLNFKLFRLDFSKEIKKDNNKIFLLFRPIRKSVSKITMILSDITLFFWIVLVYKDFNGLINKYIFFDFGIESEFHFFTFIVLVTPFIFSFYIIIFWIKGSLKRKENNSV